MLLLDIYIIYLSCTQMYIYFELLDDYLKHFF